jgi:hypothetical protein
MTNAEGPFEGGWSAPGTGPTATRSLGTDDHVETPAPFGAPVPATAPVPTPRNAIANAAPVPATAPTPTPAGVTHFDASAFGVPGTGVPGFGDPPPAAPGHGTNRFGTAPFGAPPFGAPPVGAPPFGAPGAGQFPPAQPAGRTNPLAVAALVLGIVGFLVVTPLLAIIFGVVAVRQISSSGGAQRGKGMAVTGIVLGALWIPLLATVVALGVSEMTVDPDELPTREEFIPVMVAPLEAQDLLGIEQMPPEMATEARLVLDDTMSCMYDVLVQEPRYLLEVYEDPEPAAGWHRVPGVSQARIDEIDAQAEDCWVEMDRRFGELSDG